MLKADHQQVVAFVERIASVFGIKVVGYAPGKVAGVAEADLVKRTIRFDRREADRIAVLRGPAALEFVLLHELGHLLHDQHNGRRGERLADQFAAEVQRKRGYSVATIAAAAAATLAGMPDDGTHDAGEVRVEAIRGHAARVVVSHWHIRR